MYTQPEINSFDQLLWRSERQKLYNRINDFCRQHNIDFVTSIDSNYIASGSSTHIVYMLLFDRILEDQEWHEINQQCHQHGRTVSVITDNILTDAKFDLINFYSYPQLMGMTASYSDPVMPNPAPSRLFNCFIQRTDSVRQSWFYYLHLNGLIDRGYVSLLLTQVSFYSNLSGLELFKYIHKNFGLDQLPAFNQAYRELLPIVPFRNFEEKENLLPLIMDSKYSLVLETCATDEVGPWSFTEKILRALQYPTIPLLFGAKKSIQVLESLGFDFAIDLTYLDELDWPQRQQELLKILINDSIDFDRQALYNQSVHNRELLQTWKSEYQRSNFFDEFYNKVLEH